MYTTPAGNTHGAIFNEGETSFLLSMQGQYPASWRITVLMSPENIKSDGMIVLEIINWDPASISQATPGIDLNYQKNLPLTNPDINILLFVYHQEIFMNIHQDSATQMSIAVNINNNEAKKGAT